MTEKLSDSNHRSEDTHTGTQTESEWDVFADRGNPLHNIWDVLHWAVCAKRCWYYQITHSSSADQRNTHSFAGEHTLTWPTLQKIHLRHNLSDYRLLSNAKYSPIFTAW